MQLTKSVKRESLTLIAIISDLCSPNLRGSKPVVARGTGCTPSSIRPGVPKRQFPLTPALSPRRGRTAGSIGLEFFHVFLRSRKNWQIYFPVGWEFFWFYLD